MIKLVIFDLDGTLIDSLTDLAAAANDMRARFGLGELSPDEVRRLVGEGATRLVERALPGLGPEAVRVGLEHFLDYNYRHLVEQTVFYPGVVPTLELLRQHGCLLAVASNKSEPHCREILRLLGADRFFAAILGAESAAERKPSPAPVLQLMRQFTVTAEETAMIGDSINDMAAGKGAGVLTIGCDYGYGTAEELQGADRIVSAIGEIIPLLAAGEYR